MLWGVDTRVCGGDEGVAPFLQWYFDFFVRACWGGERIGMPLEERLGDRDPGSWDECQVGLLKA